MGFSKMIELLQEKEKGKIILVNAGSFYIARGKDAILLHDLLNLKLNCLETEVCKVGFPINSLEKYTKLIEEKNYSYIVYKFDNKLYKLTEVKKYFDNINKKILLEILQRKIKDKNLIWLIQEILYSQKREKGIEIGNYTSHMFANIYLNEIDQYIKNKLHIKYYCRYLDDSIIIVKTKEEAKYALEKMNYIFVYGKIISNIKFEFILNSKKKSISFFELELTNKSKIKVKAYNEIADYCYSKLKLYDSVFIEGRLNSNIEVEGINIRKINKKSNVSK